MTITVEWVEVTGRTLEEATERALEQLGVEESDAEVEVLEEPRSGLFGRTRGEARVRARVKPKGPRPKQERRRRTPRSGEAKGSADTADRPDDAPAEDAAAAAGGAAKDEPADRRPAGAKRQGNDRSRPTKERTMMDQQAQQDTVTGFLDGLVEAMGVTATTGATIEDGLVRASVDGDQLGILVGPGLATLEAIQEISRNVLQREAGDREHGKVVLDVAGVRELRREALADFVATAAERARTDEVDVVLEVMSSVDRKTVHDTVAELDGVVSVSEGEDPRRRVVIRPA